MSRFTIKQRMAQIEGFLQDRTCDDITFVYEDEGVLLIQSDRNGILFHGPRPEGEKIISSLDGLIVRIPFIP